MNVQSMPEGGLLCCTTHRDSGTESEGEACKSFNEIFNKSSFEYKLYFFFKSLHPIISEIRKTD